MFCIIVRNIVGITVVQSNKSNTFLEIYKQIDFYCLSKVYPFITDLNYLFGTSLSIIDKRQTTIMSDFRVLARQLIPFVKDPSLYYLWLRFKYYNDLQSKCLQIYKVEKISFCKNSHKKYVIMENFRINLNRKIRELIPKEFRGIPNTQALINFRDSLTIIKRKTSIIESNSLADILGNCDFAIHLFSTIEYEFLRLWVQENAIVDVGFSCLYKILSLKDKCLNIHGVDILQLPLLSSDLVLSNSLICKSAVKVSNNLIKLLAKPMLNDLLAMIEKLHSKNHFNSSDIKYTTSVEKIRLKYLFDNSFCHLKSVLVEHFKDKVFYQSNEYVPSISGCREVFSAELAVDEYEALLHVFMQGLLFKGMQIEWIVRLISCLVPNTSSTLYKRLLRFISDYYGVKTVNKRVRLCTNFKADNLTRVNKDCLTFAAIVICYASGFDIYSLSSIDDNDFFVIRPKNLDPMSILIAYNFVVETCIEYDVSIMSCFITFAYNVTNKKIGLILTKKHEVEFVLLDDKIDN